MSKFYTEFMAELDRHHKKMTALVCENETTDLSDAQVKDLIDFLTKKEMWGPKNDVTLKNVTIETGSLGKAFCVLTDGNLKIKPFVDRVLKGEILCKETETEDEPERGIVPQNDFSTLEPKPKPKKKTKVKMKVKVKKRKPGRPRKIRT